eukprot:2467138-Rhodomonas_salina.1
MVKGLSFLPQVSDTTVSGSTAGRLVVVPGAFQPQSSMHGSNTFESSQIGESDAHRVRLADIIEYARTRKADPFVFTEPISRRYLESQDQSTTLPGCGKVGRKSTRSTLRM